MNKRDVVIVGGSLAGAACVRELHRLGVDAIALERDRFPRRKVCGGFLSPAAVSRVEQIGLLDEVLGAGAVEVTSARVRAGGVAVEIPFAQPGLGISRTVLDEIFARGSCVHEAWSVQEVQREGRGFIVDGIPCSVVIDASGKLGRFSSRRTVDEFGIQYVEPGGRGSVMDFWFFDDGYGGGVSIEGGQSNFCFLIKKAALAKHIDRQGCVVTGPLAYDKLPGEFIAIGDAMGMMDPFCGEGMCHALDSGMMAARVVASGLRHRVSYADMKYQYEAAWDRRWAVKRALATAMRAAVWQSWPVAAAMRLAPSWMMRVLWSNPGLAASKS